MLLIHRLIFSTLVSRVLFELPNNLKTDSEKTRIEAGKRHR